MMAKLLAVLFACMPILALAQEWQLPIANFTGFDNASLQKYLLENLPAEQIEYMKKEKRAIFVWNTYFSLDSGSHYCWTIIGPTESAPDDLHPRYPNWSLTSVYRMVKQGKMTPEEENECQSESFMDTVKGMSKTPLDKLMKDSHLALSSRGKREKEPPDSTMAHVYTEGLDKEGKEAVFKAIPDIFRSTFDYRHTAVDVWTKGLRFDDGSFVCFAAAGLTARPPGGRYPRIPGYQYSSFLKLTPEQAQRRGAAEECREDVAVRAVKALMASPYDETGILEGISRTREEDIPLPKPVKQKAGSKKAASASQVQHATTCQTRCVNGDCIREWPDGRKERFQATRRYNALTNQWEWDTGGC